MTRRLQGRIAAVTGAARIEQAVAEMKEASHDVHAYALEVSQRSAVYETMGRLEADFGAPLGVPVSNAAWVHYQAPQEIDDETLDRMLGVGVKALIWAMQAAQPQLQCSGHGAVIDASSVNGELLAADGGRSNAAL